MENEIDPMATSVLIIILNWMKYDDTNRCVSSLLKLDYPDFKIYLIDNASVNDSIARIQEEFPDIIIHKTNKNLGYAAGNKIGVDFALRNNFDAVWILNNDCAVRKDALKELVAAYKRNGDALYSNLTLMSENPDIIHYAGTYKIDEPLQPDKYPTYDKLKGSLLEDCRHQLVEGPARIYGHSMFIPVSVIRKYGFMDTRYFLFYEETDYCHSLYNKGIQSIFVPGAVITHKSTSTFTLSPKMKYVVNYYETRNKIFFEKKYGTSQYKEVIKEKGGFWGFLVFFVRHYLQINKSDLQLRRYYYNIGILHGIIGLRGKIVKPEKMINN